MATNLERYKKDLERLLGLGVTLDLAMTKELWKDDGFSKQVRKQFGEKDGEAILKNLPEFKTSYEEWYSESLVLLRQLPPDRLSNFVGLYERPRTRKSADYENYVIQDYLQGLTVTCGGVKIAEPVAALPKFRQQRAILEAAKVRFESSLFEIRQLVQADLFDSEIDAARELLKNRFTRAAGAVAGVVLERHLRQVCEDHSVKITKKNPGISFLNELLKANSVIDLPQWRHISLLGDLRNLCDHDKLKEPTRAQVSDLIDGTVKAIKTIS